MIVIISIVVNILIFYCIYADIKEHFHQDHYENLINQAIYVNVTEDELELIEKLTSLNGFEDKNKYLRGILKDEMVKKKQER